MFLGMTNNFRLVAVVSVSACNVSVGNDKERISWLQFKLCEVKSSLARNVLWCFIAPYKSYIAPLAVKSERPIRIVAFRRVMVRLPTVTDVFCSRMGKAH